MGSGRAHVALKCGIDIGHPGESDILAVHGAVFLLVRSERQEARVPPDRLYAGQQDPVPGQMRLEEEGVIGEIAVSALIVPDDVLLICLALPRPRPGSAHQVCLAFPANVW